MNTKDQTPQYQNPDVISWEDYEGEESMEYLSDVGVDYVYIEDFDYSEEIDYQENIDYLDDFIYSEEIDYSDNMDYQDNIHYSDDFKYSEGIDYPDDFYHLEDMDFSDSSKYWPYDSVMDPNYVIEGMNPNETIAESDSDSEWVKKSTDFLLLEDESAISMSSKKAFENPDEDFETQNFTLDSNEELFHQYQSPTLSDNASFTDLSEDIDTITYSDQPEKIELTTSNSELSEEIDSAASSYVSTEDIETTRSSSNQPEDIALDVSHSDQSGESDSFWSKTPVQLSLFPEEELDYPNSTESVTYHLEEKATTLSGSDSEFELEHNPLMITPEEQDPTSMLNSQNDSTKSTELNESCEGGMYPPGLDLSRNIDLYHPNYDYVPKDGQLFTEVYPELPPVHKKQSDWIPETSNPPKPKKKESKFRRKPLTDLCRVLNYEDFDDVDDYLKLADRPLIPQTPIFGYRRRKPILPTWYDIYEAPQEPIAFIGRLDEVRESKNSESKCRAYCFTTMGLNKYRLHAFLNKKGQYTPSYCTFDLTDVEFGTWWYCKVVRAVKSGNITWAKVLEVKSPCLKDIFQNPDPKFRPKGWNILNNKIIFDPTLLEGHSTEELEEFNVKVERGKTNVYFGSVEGLLG